MGRFTDNSLMMLSGEYTGWRLSNIPIEFWDIFIEEHEHLIPPHTGNERLLWYQTTLGATMAYALERTKPEATPLKGRVYITNGAVARSVPPDFEIPEGWWLERPWNPGNPMTDASPEVIEERKKKISNTLKEFYKTEEGEKYRKAISKRKKGKKVRRKITNKHGVNGVYYNKKEGRYYVHLGSKRIGRRVHLKDAIALRLKAEKKYYGNL